MDDFANMSTVASDDDEQEQPRTMDLEVDVTWKAQRVTRLHLQEPTGRQVEAAEKEIGSTPTPYQMRRYQITLIAQVAKVPREVVEGLRVSQIEEAFDFLSGLLDRGPKIGGT